MKRASSNQPTCMGERQTRKGNQNGLVLGKIYLEIAQLRKMPYHPPVRKSSLHQNSDLSGRLISGPPYPQDPPSFQVVFLLWPLSSTYFETMQDATCVAPTIYLNDLNYLNLKPCHLPWLNPTSSANLHASPQFNLYIVYRFLLDPTVFVQFPMELQFCNENV